jgi:hypothetical protein
MTSAIAPSCSRATMVVRQIGTSDTVRNHHMLRACWAMARRLKTPTRMTAMTAMTVR